MQQEVVCNEWIDAAGSGGLWVDGTAGSGVKWMGQQRRVAYPCLKARKARCLRNTEIRAMQRKQG